LYASDGKMYTNKKGKEMDNRVKIIAMLPPNLYDNILDDSNKKDISVGDQMRCVLEKHYKGNRIKLANELKERNK